MTVGRPAKFNTADEMEPLIEAYFNDCDEKGKPYTVPGLAYGLGFADKQSLIDYAAKDEFSFTIKAAKARIEQQRAEELVGRNGTVTGLIFDLKNNFGWKDAQQHEHTVKKVSLWGKNSSE